MKLNRCTNRVTTPFGDFQVDVDNLFDHVFGSRHASETKGADWTPRVTITESETGYAIDVELPGVSPEDVNLEMSDNRLEVSGNKNLAELPDGVKRVREERTHGEFRRAFEFAQLVNVDEIQADYRNGVLHIEVPKSEAVLPKKIEIKINDGD